MADKEATGKNAGRSEKTKLKEEYFAKINRRTFQDWYDQNRVILGLPEEDFESTIGSINPSRESREGLIASSFIKIVRLLGKCYRERKVFDGCSFQDVATNPNAFKDQTLAQQMICDSFHTAEGDNELLDGANDSSQELERVANPSQRSSGLRWQVVLAAGSIIVALLVWRFYSSAKPAPMITVQTMVLAFGDTFHADQSESGNGPLVPGDIPRSPDLLNEIRKADSRLDKLAAAILAHDKEATSLAIVEADPNEQTLFDAYGSLLKARNLGMEKDFHAAEVILLALSDHSDITTRISANRERGRQSLSQRLPNDALWRFDLAEKDLRLLIQEPANQLQLQLAQFELTQLYFRMAKLRTDGNLSKVKENYKKCQERAASITLDDPWLVKRGIHRTLSRQLSILHTDLGIWFERAEEFDLAIAAYTSSIDRQSSLESRYRHAQPFGNLAWIRVGDERYRNYASAVDLANLAVEIADAEPKHRDYDVPRYLDTLAVALEGLGQLDQAILARERSVRFESSPDIKALKSSLDELRKRHVNESGG